MKMDIQKLKVSVDNGCSSPKQEVGEEKKSEENMYFWHSTFKKKKKKRKKKKKAHVLKCVWNQGAVERLEVYQISSGLGLIHIGKKRSKEK